MVAPATPRLEFVPQVNLSRMFLFRASDALDAGRILECGVLLREAVLRQLYAECAWKGCLPTKPAKRRSPMALLHALKDAGCCNTDGFQWTSHIIATCNKCAHCKSVTKWLLRESIITWHEVIDHDPCGEPTDRPIKPHPTDPLLSANDDNDDENDGEEWKGVAV